MPATDYDSFTEDFAELRFLIATVLFGSVHAFVVVGIDMERVRFLTYAIYLIWATWMAIIISPFIAYICVPLLTMWIMVAVYEILYDEFCAVLHEFDPQPAIGGRVPGTPWLLAAAIKSSNNGYNFRQFYSATVCDFGAVDDPFWPHTSTVCVIEVRRRGLTWRTITIWEVSLLNGGQKVLHEFQQFLEWTDAGGLRARRFKSRGMLKCFQSGGVVFVSFRCFGDNVLYVYDRRYKKAATYTLPEPPESPFRRTPLAIWCLGRYPGVNGSIDGWRIRWLDSSYELGQGGEGGMVRVRARIINEVLELRQDVRLADQQEIVFGKFDVWNGFFDIKIWIRHRVVRIGDRLGLATNRSFFEPWYTMIYDPKKNDWQCIRGEFGMVFVGLSQEWRARLTLPSPDANESRRRQYAPVVMTKLDVVKCTGTGAVYRAEFGLPSLKYLAAKELFRAIPGLRERMNADRFRWMSGIDGVGGHFC